MEEKNCQHLIAHLSDYLDGDASAAICAQIDEHLKGCDDCRVVVDTLRQTVKLYHTLPQPDMPQGLREKLFKSLDLKPFLKPEEDENGAAQQESANHDV